MKSMGRSSKMACQQQNSTFYVRYSASAYDQVGQAMQESVGKMTPVDSPKKKSGQMTRSAECLLDDTEDQPSKPLSRSAAAAVPRKGKEKSVFYIDHEDHGGMSDGQMGRSLTESVARHLLLDQKQDKRRQVGRVYFGTLFLATFPRLDNATDDHR